MHHSSRCVGQADELLRPGNEFDPAGLRRTFSVQASELFVTVLAVPLLEGLRRDAPGTDVVFAPEALEGTSALRHGDIDVELGVLGHLDPETRHQPLIQTRLVGVARAANPLFEAPIDVGRFAAADHIGISRRGRQRGPIDEALAVVGLRRRVALVVPSHTSAMLVARSTDLIALTTAEWLTAATADLKLRTFPIPLDLPQVDIGMAWHPRNHDDPAHRWFRRHLRSTLIASQPTARTELV